MFRLHRRAFFLLLIFSGWLIPVSIFCYDIVPAVCSVLFLCNKSSGFTYGCTSLFRLHTSIETILSTTFHLLDPAVDYQPSNMSADTDRLGLPDCPGWNFRNVRFVRHLQQWEIPATQDWVTSLFSLKAGKPSI